MRNPTTYRLNPFILLLLAGLLAFTACDPATTTSDSDTEPEVESIPPASPPPSSEAVKQFFHAWMADCANDHYYYQWSHSGAKESALKSLRGLAERRLTNALSNQVISDSLGQENLVWGPAISVSHEPETSTGYYYIVDNLLYCVQSMVGDTKHFSIGISGTNPISVFDWLTEDINQGTVPDTAVGGSIAQGSDIGLSILKSLKDSVQQNTLLAFLQQKLTADPTITISVAGHSLGGALTQVYSGYLKSQLGSAADVEAWVYAGPTAGDSIFAHNLVEQLSAENYHAYNNSLDVVPHVWQADSLSKICSIYQGRKLCKWDIEDNILVNMINQYVKDISSDGNYAIPGTPQTFTQDLSPLSLTGCASLFSGAVTAWSLSPSFKINSKEIQSKCGITDETEGNELLILPPLKGKMRKKGLG